MFDVGKRIKDRRTELGLSAEDLAPLVGLSPATIYRYENGEIKNLKTTKLQPFARALKTTEAYLMGWCADPGNFAPAEQPNEQMQFSAAAMRIAEIYDALDAAGQELLNAVADLQAKRIDEYGRCDAQPRRLKVIHTVHDSDLYARYTSRREVEEIDSEDIIVHEYD